MGRAAFVLVLVKTDDYFVNAAEGEEEGNVAGVDDCVGDIRERDEGHGVCTSGGREVRRVVVVVEGFYRLNVLVGGALTKNKQIAPPLASEMFIMKNS